MTDHAQDRWGVVATIRASEAEILRFVAYHLDLGAHRVFIYLDAPYPGAMAPLKGHPGVRVTLCDDDYWRRRGLDRPEQHQVRQARNAGDAYRRAGDLDWLTHIDVDEFLLPRRPVHEILGALPASIRLARMRPLELLAGGDGRAWKDFIPAGPDRARKVDALYPTYGRYLRGGFLSHVAGKLFLRTGLPGIGLRIHNAFQGGERLSDGIELDSIGLLHRHTESWEDWRARYAFRLSQGSYRADLDPAAARDRGGMTKHDLLRYLEATEGERGLRAFFAEVAEDSPVLRQRLESQGVLRLVDLDLVTPLENHFPDAM